jgi:hypothetical protein
VAENGEWKLYILELLGKEGEEKKKTWVKLGSIWSIAI